MAWWRKRRIGQLPLVLGIIGVVAAIAYLLAIRGVMPVVFEDPYTPVLRQHNWIPLGTPDIVTVTLSPAEELPSAMGPPWALYLQASQEIGLDFTRYAGQTLPLRVYRLSNEARQDLAVRGFLLVADDSVVGAWLDVEQGAPGLYPLNTKPEALAP